MPSDDADRPLFAVRRERRMTRTHALLWAVILASTVADVLLTMVGTANGLAEGIVGALMGAFGPAGLWLVNRLGVKWFETRSVSSSRESFALSNDPEACQWAPVLPE